MAHHIDSDFFYSYRFYLEVGMEGRETMDREEEKKSLVYFNLLLKSPKFNLIRGKNAIFHSVNE